MNHEAHKNPLLYGLIGFFIGGLLVSVAATTFEAAGNTPGDSMHAMTEDLRGKTGDEFDKAFLAGMIEHHQSALDMAKLSESRAEHDEIKTLSREIIASQQSEITEMKEWQHDWGYADDTPHDDMSH